MIIERAARAAQEADGAYRHESGMWMKEGGLVTDSHWQDIARAVIEALREPLFEAIDHCIEHGAPKSGHDLPVTAEYDLGRKSAFRACRAMIDAALSEGG